MARPVLNDINTTAGLLAIGYIPNKAPVASLNAAGLESLIQTKGFKAIHVLSAPLPDRHSFGAPPNPSTQGAYAGRMYYDSRPLQIVPSSIKLEERLQVQGIYDVYSIIINVAGQYSDTRRGQSDQVYIKHNDLIIPDFGVTVLAEQLFEYNATGTQRLNFSVVGVQYLADGDFVYEQDTDFIVKDGNIVWLPSGVKPKVNGDQGAVLTCVYYTSPIFCVQALPHTLRIIPSNSSGSGAQPREATYAPQLIIAKNLTAANINPFDGNLLNEKQSPNLPGYQSGSTTGGSF